MSCSINKITLERYTNPLALLHPTPRISWRFEGNAIDWKQAAYDLRLHINGKVLDHHVDTEQSVFNPWPFADLRSRESFTLEVRAISTAGKATEWASTQGEVALLDQTEWKVSTTVGPKHPIGQAKRPFLLRYNFISPTSPSRARLYITALGVQQAFLNGAPIGDEVLAPGWQSYKHRLHYSSFDISDLIKEGENTFTCWIGEGWYAGRLGFHGGWRDTYGEGDLGLIAQLEVDGKVVMGTGSDGWDWAYGQLVSSEIYDGEHFDASQTPTEWHPAGRAPLPSAKLIAPEAPPVRRKERLAVQEIITTPSGKTILDFGQNLVGWVRFLQSPPSNATVSLKHAEVMEHGELGTRPLRVCKATDTVKGGKEGWEPTFTFHGFRYVQVEGWEGLTKESMKAVVIYSDMERTGDFSCSHEGMTKFHENTLWGLRGNFVSVPTDCPQRDERLGWTGDLQVFAPTASFLYDTLGLLADWLDDLKEEQLKDYDGKPPLVVPNILKDATATFALWGDVTALTPDDLYEAYGDRKILEDQWESTVAWLDRAIKRSKSELWDPEVVQLGDWLDPQAPEDNPSDSPSDTILVSDAVLVNTTKVAARIATILGRTENAKRYADQADKLRRAFQAEYVTGNGRIVSDTQTTFALALKYDLIPSSAIPAAAARLDYLIRKRAFKIQTGFAGTPVLLPALVKSGLINTAYRMFQEKQCPSLLYPISMGATTIWERWNSMLPDGTINPGEMTSFNHYALGSVSMFLYGVVGGIAPTKPGWKEVTINPRPGGTVTSAKVSHVSPYGRISCDWEIKGNKLVVNVEIPPNSTGTVILPGVREEIGSGKKRYEVEWKPDSNWPPKAIQPGKYRQPLIDEVVV